MLKRKQFLVEWIPVFPQHGMIVDRVRKGEKLAVWDEMEEEDLVDCGGTETVSWWEEFLLDKVTHNNIIITRGSRRQASLKIPKTEVVKREVRV